MDVTRVFLCYAPDLISPKDLSLLARLSARLREMSIEIVQYPGHLLAQPDPNATLLAPWNKLTHAMGSAPPHLDEEKALAFLQQHLPDCQWLLLIQTPGIGAFPHVVQAVITAMNLANQGHMLGVLRVITASDEEDLEMPSEWEILPAFDATHDPLRAIERVALALSPSEPNAELLTFTSTSSLPESVFDSSTYDRPVAPPSHWRKFRGNMRNTYQDVLYTHKRSMVILSVMLLAVLFAAILSALALRAPSAARARPKVASAGVPEYGQVSFFSTNLAGTEMTAGVADEVKVSLHNVPSPASGKSYDAWLLSDAKNSEGPRILVGQFTPTHGSASLSFQNPAVKNLLANESQLLITEERTSPAPSFPTSDLGEWRYYGEFPQEPNPRDAQHLSALDHLRHLMSDDSMMGMVPLPGGLGVWMLQNVRLVFEWASDARGVGNATDPKQERTDFIKILDALDGTESVGQDVPQHTPLLVDPVVSRKPLLTIDPKAMVPGYLLEIHTHLFGFADSPGTTPDEQALAGTITAELDRITKTLTQVRQDAKQLVVMTDKQLLDPATIPQLDDLVNQAMRAYTGQMNPAAGSQQRGVTQVFAQCMQLAQFPVIKYMHQVEAVSAKANGSDGSGSSTPTPPGSGGSTPTPTPPSSGGGIPTPPGRGGNLPTPTPTPSGRGGNLPTPIPTPPGNGGSIPEPPGSTVIIPSVPHVRWWIDTFANSPGYRGGWTQVGTLNAGTNYVYCKQWGAKINDSAGNYNHYWLWTDLDTGGSGWVSAYYLSRWGNDQAKDNAGNVIPDC